ncbi:hypothetical protein LX97_02523 [Nonlabens dokdonensis]|jgi:YbbR domain-containing protein|uniref:YbbR-like protein n=2 Tax=Nonlabens dokdonensis TaxID=328515 RepID=L7WFI2_NONDD|nr:hypothetical protein [Nonlabens dokdonensis]AGC78716.1 hypothetical protein DDD_3589 [Nonlabens dokdonensis DSW-6]PZX39157.1 hypothetical protein LX97_02523 [Nonlabens dokdonensis]
MRYKKILSFLLVVAVVASLWFISKYKDDYREEVVFNISFTNIPNSIILLENSKEVNIPVEIKASGFTLIWEKIFDHSIELDFNQNTYIRNDSLFFSSTKSIKNIRKLKSRTYELLDIDDQEIALEYKKYVTKKVPIINQIKTEYSNNYYPLVQPFFQTDSVVITGNDNKVNELDEFKVSVDSKIVVHDTLTTISVDLKDIDPELNFNPQELVLTIKATQVTEGKFDIQIELVNNKNDYDVKIIPDTVQLIFSSPVSEFEGIDINDFDIYLDYDKVDDLNISIIPEVKIKNDNIISYRISPSQVQVLTIK